MPDTPSPPDRPDPAPPASETPLVERAVVRRSPRYRAFVVVGTAVGVIVAVVAVLALGSDGSRAMRVVLIAAGAAAVLGGLVGGLVAVLLDGPARRA